MLLKVKELLKNFAENTTAHGISKIVGTNRIIIRLLWILIVSVAATSCVLLMYQLITQFFRREVLTQSRVRYDSVVFPAVTVCNLNPVRRSRTWYGDNVEGMTFNLTSIVDGLTTSSRIVVEGPTFNCTAGGQTILSGQVCDGHAQCTDESDEAQCDNDLELIYQNPWAGNTSSVPWREDKSQNFYRSVMQLPLANRREMGHGLTELIPGCTWDARHCYNTSWIRVVDSAYGNCYTFNSFKLDNLHEQLRSGQSNGLSLIIFINRRDNIERITESIGVRVLVHENEEYPLMRDRGFTVNTGHRATVQLSQTKSTRKGPPFSDCVDGNTDDLLWPGGYSLQNCIKSCQLKEIIKQCNCADDVFPGSTEYPLCRSAQQLNCTSKTYRTTSRICICPQKCQQNLFVYSQTAMEWPVDALADELKSIYERRNSDLNTSLNEENGVRRNILKLDVYYEILRYENKVESEAYPIARLLGDIGGQLGLWIGISVITIIEMGDLSITIMKHIYRDKQEKKRLLAAGAQQQKAEEEDEKKDKTIGKSQANMLPSTAEDAEQRFTYGNLAYQK